MLVGQGHINITAITDMVYYIHSWKYFQKMSIAISFRITYVKWSSSRLFDIEILFCFKDFLLSFFFFYFQLWNLNCQSTFSRLSGSTRRNQIHFWYPNNSLYLLLLASQSCNIHWVYGEIRISIWNWVVHYSGVKTISTLNKN